MADVGQSDVRGIEWPAGRGRKDWRTCVLGDDAEELEGGNIERFSSAPENEAALLTAGRGLADFARGPGQFETGTLLELAKVAVADGDTLRHCEARFLGLGIRPSCLYDDMV